MNNNQQNPYNQNGQSDIDINTQQNSNVYNIPQQPYEYNHQYQVYDAQPVLQNTSNAGGGMAIASLILSIVSLVCCCAGTPCAILGLIFGIIARKNNPQNNMALAGIIIASVGLVWSIGSLVWAIATGTLSFYVSPGGTPFVDPYDTYNWI